MSTAMKAPYDSPNKTYKKRKQQSFILCLISRALFSFQFLVPGAFVVIDSKIHATFLVVDELDSIDIADF